jgi:hypothetical protein
MIDACLWLDELERLFPEYYPPEERRCAKAGCNNVISIGAQRTQRYCSVPCREADSGRRQRSRNKLTGTARKLCARPGCNNVFSARIRTLGVEPRRRFCSERCCRLTWQDAQHWKEYRAQWARANEEKIRDYPRPRRAAEQAYEIDQLKEHIHGIRRGGNDNGGNDTSSE